MKIEIGKSILHLNDAQSRRNRRRFDQLGLVAVNVLASPGAGKTSVILRLLKGLAKRWQVGVIEGDQASSVDTEKVRAAGYPAEQINTHGGCHLEARTVGKAAAALGIQGPGYLFIENIGNLICPSQFHLGERVRLVIASVPEGDDKPLKYPGIFTTADCVLLNKSDLLAHVDFSLERFEAALRAVNPTAPLFVLSCRTGKGVPAILKWLQSRQPPSAGQIDHEEDHPAGQSLQPDRPDQATPEIIGPA